MLGKKEWRAGRDESGLQSEGAWMLDKDAMRLIPGSCRGVFVPLLAALLLMAAAPAFACGCGAYIPAEGDASVVREQALIHWDGRTEDIVMGLSVEGRSEEAAWILPVPSRATVKLADPRLFDELHELTKPLIKLEKVPIEDGVTGSVAPGAGSPGVGSIPCQHSGGV